MTTQDNGQLLYRPCSVSHIDNDSGLNKVEMKYLNFTA